MNRIFDLISDTLLDSQSAVSTNYPMMASYSEAISAPYESGERGSHRRQY